MNHHKNELIIRNISRTDLSKYECDASNGILPSISKKFTIGIKYAPIVVPVKTVIQQVNNDPLLIGCRVSSNPESTIKWYRKKLTDPANKSSYDQFEEIDLNSHQRYQHLNFKQTNQTVSYFKINVSTLIHLGCSFANLKFKLLVSFSPPIFGLSIRLLANEIIINLN